MFVCVCVCVCVSVPEGTQTTRVSRRKERRQREMTDMAKTHMLDKKAQVSMLSLQLSVHSDSSGVYISGREGHFGSVPAHSRPKPDLVSFGVNRSPS